MTRITRIVAAALAATLLGFTALAPPAQASVSDYIEFVREEIPEAVYIPSRTISSLGKTICRGLNMMPVGDVVDSADGTGLSNSEVAVLVVGAVWFICPKHKGKVQRWIEANT